MALTCARFAGVDRLERCLSGELAARLTPGTTGESVALVQQALMDLGESLPLFGADGAYGPETTSAVLKYKTRHGISTPDGTIDGVVGKETMAKLDEDCTATDEAVGACPLEPDGPVVDLGGTDERLVNMVLANTAAATLPRTSCRTPTCGRARARRRADSGTPLRTIPNPISETPRGSRRVAYRRRLLHAAAAEGVQTGGKDDLRPDSEAVA